MHRPCEQCGLRSWLLRAMPPWVGRSLAAGLLSIAGSFLSGAAPGAGYDLVLRGGRVVDGTGNPWFYGDVGVRGDRIERVGRIGSGQAGRELDATGLVVAPGFIDAHAHSEYLLLEDGRAESKVRQGVTTEVFGEGASAGPFQGKLTPHPVSVRNEAVRLASLGDYFKAVETAGVSVNVVSYVGLGNLWQSVMGHSFARPTTEEFERMRELLVAALDQGAAGLSCQLMMPPGSLATMDDLLGLCEVLRRRGGLLACHVRNEGLGVFESVREMIEIARRSRVPVDILHLKIADQQYWGRMPEVLGLIDDARQEGVDVQANVYPYTRGQNDLSSIIPPWAHEGGREAMLARLRDPGQRVKLKEDIRRGLPGWYNHYTAVGGDWGRMLISGQNRYQGLTMDRVIAQRTAGQSPVPDPLDVLFDLLLEMQGSVGTVYEHHTEADMTLALARPWCSIGSDGSAYAVEGPLRRGNPHPRSFGTFSRVLGVYARERRLLSLEDAVRKMTSLNAAKLGLSGRGLLREGFLADLAVFDPSRVIDRASYEDPFRYGEGLEYVVVNGEVVVEKGRHTGAMPGRVLRIRH